MLTSGLVDMLDDEERFFVIAHELGHIKAGHVLYTVLARNIAAVVNLIGQATLGLGALLGQGLVIALYDWYRKAELTADRAGLLCVQDIDPCIRTFMKMAGGASRLYAEMDQTEFVRQIRAYEDADRSGLNRAYKLLLTAFRTPPLPHPARQGAGRVARHRLPRSRRSPRTADGLTSDPERVPPPALWLRLRGDDQHWLVGAFLRVEGRLALGRS